MCSIVFAITSVLNQSVLKKEILLYNKTSGGKLQLAVSKLLSGI